MTRTSEAAVSPVLLRLEGPSGVALGSYAYTVCIERYNARSYEPAKNIRTIKSTRKRMLYPSGDSI